MNKKVIGIFVVTLLIATTFSGFAVGRAQLNLGPNNFQDIQSGLGKQKEYSEIACISNHLNNLPNQPTKPEEPTTGDVGESYCYESGSFWMDLKPGGGHDGGKFENENSKWNIYSHITHGDFDNTGEIDCVSWPPSGYDGIYSAIRNDEDLWDGTSANGAWCVCAAEEGGWGAEDSRGYTRISNLETYLDMDGYVDTTLPNFQITSATLYCDYKMQSIDFNNNNNYVYFTIFIGAGGNYNFLKFDKHSGNSDAPNNLASYGHPGGGYCTDYWDPGDNWVANPPDLKEYTKNDYQVSMMYGGQTLANWLNNYGITNDITLNFHLDIRLYGDTLFNWEEFAFLLDDIGIYCEYSYDIPPSVETKDASNLGTHSARLNGKIIDDEGAICQVRFSYREKGESNWNYPSGWHGSYSTGDTFYEDISGLEEDTTYQFQAGAKNSAGEEWGDTKEFITEFSTTPILSYSPDTINFGTHDQGWTGSDTFEIWNSGTGTLSYTVSESLDWITSTNPSSGSSTGEHDTIAVNVGNTGSMSGYSSGYVSISSNGGSDSVFVDITINVPPQTITFYTDPTDKGYITFDGNNYNNGQSTTKPDGNYNINGNPSSGYIFAHWETSGGVNVANSNQQSTTATVNDHGTLKAYFIPGNQPPDPPYNPNPNNHATDQSINIALSWSCSDPDGDPLTYDVYFGTSSNPPNMSSNQGSTSYDPDTLLYDTKYYWKIVAKDDHGHSTPGSIWDFTTGTELNVPPNTPSNPSPAFGAADIDVDVDLSWTGGDPNPGDTVTYDVYFGTNQNNLDLISQNQASTTYNPGTLEFEKAYYWKIVAKDNHDHSTIGPIWYFTTQEWDCTSIPNFYFPRATEAKIDKLKLDAFIPVPWWDLNEAEYPNYGYKATYNKYYKTAESKLYDEHCGVTDPIYGIGIPESYVLDTKIGHKYTFPSCGSDVAWTPPCRVLISGNYGMDGLAGWLKTGWLGRADIVISLVIVHEGLPIWGEREFKIDSYGIGPIEDTWSNIKDSFSIQTPEDIYFQYGETYSFHLKAKASLFLTSQGIPFISWLPPIPACATGWAAAEIGAKFNNIQLIWQDDLSSSLNRNGNLPPTIPDQGHGSEGIVDEEHIFYSDGSTDPNGDQILYKWHWDDGTTSEWIGPYPSGDPVTASHTYTKPGAYNVKLEAKDIYDAWSGLSVDSFNGMKYPEGKIIVNRPNSNDKWRRGETYDITWNCSGYTGDFVKIVLYQGDGNENYELHSEITTDPIQNSGSYSWNIDSNIEIGNDYRIAVYDLTNAANCSNIFSITENQGPNKPDKPSGPTSGVIGEEYTFTTIATDPEGGQIKYGWDWNGDRVIDEWDPVSGYYPSGTESTVSHSWNKKATYNVRVKARDKDERESSWSEPLIITILNTPPDKPSKPVGKSSGKSGTEYTYSTSTNDADAHRVKYCFDWGDGETTTTEYKNSGETASAQHTWNTKGNYNIKVKAVDEYGEESEWSEPLSVSMPKNKPYINSLFLQFLENHPHLFPLLRQLLGLQ